MGTADSVVTYHPRESLWDVVKRELLPAGVVLDIGCGIRPQALVRPLVHVCAEPFQDYVAALQAVQSGQQDRLWLNLQYDWQRCVDALPEASVDSVFLLDVIEHLPKEDVAKLLKKTLKVARRQICIWTPLGFMPQHHADGIDAWGMRGGVWQEHRSGWLPGEFQEPGWRFYVCEDFHVQNNMGKLLDKPFGAFFAVHTKDQDLSATARTSLALRTLSDDPTMTNLVLEFSRLATPLPSDHRSRLLVAAELAARTTANELDAVLDFAHLAAPLPSDHRSRLQAAAELAARTTPDELDTFFSWLEATGRESESSFRSFVRAAYASSIILWRRMEKARHAHRDEAEGVRTA